MDVNLSVSHFVIIVISVTILILGIFLIFRVIEIGKDIPSYPVSPGQIHVEVYPKDSIKGTKFFISAYNPSKKEEQNLDLIIERENYYEELSLYDDGKHYDKKEGDGFYGGFFDSSEKPTGEYQIKKYEESLANFKVSDSGCELISGNGREDGINFIILPYNYSDFEDFRKDANKIINLKDSFINLEPFKSNKNKFSFSILKTDGDLECQIGCKNVSTIICCNNNKVMGAASKCHFDSIVILINSDALCGSASSYAKVCTRNQSFETVLVHEIGHSFGDLADEYVYSDYFEGYDVGEINNPNCDKEGCNKWKNLTSGCFKGCTYSNLYRSIEEKSTMYDLYPEYNVVSQKYMEKIISDFSTKEKGNEKSMPYKKSYFIEIKYDSGKISADRVSLKPVKAGFNYKKSDYRLNINDEFGNKIFESNLYIPNKIYSAGSSPVILDEVEFPLILPYFPNSDNLTIYNKEKPILTIPLAIFGEKCGNNICEESENHLSCAQDCDMNNDNFCEKSVCDPNCPSQKNCRVTGVLKYTLPFLFVLISLIAIIVILVRGFKRK